MSPEPKRTRIVIEEILAEIDERPFIQTLTTIVSEVSPKADLTQVHSVLTRAVRCACLLDLYEETNDPKYREELAKQRSKFYEEVPNEFHSELEKVENEVIKFFSAEKILIEKIKKGDTFSMDEIKQYLLGKSGDNLFYGKVLECLVPEWNLTKGLQIHTMLFDIGKDLIDYEEDVKNRLPNILWMCEISGIDKNKILNIARNLKDEALDSKNIKTSSTLRQAIEKNYEIIAERLKKE